MKHFIFIVIILLLITAAYFLFKEKEKSCGLKPLSAGKWICKDGNWVRDLTCGPKPTTGNYRCMRGQWVNVTPTIGIKDFNISPNFSPNNL